MTLKVLLERKDSATQTYVLVIMFMILSKPINASDVCYSYFASELKPFTGIAYLIMLIISSNGGR